MIRETVSFPGSVDSLEAIRDYVGQKARGAGLSGKPLYNLKLAIDEIATNIILYGYEEAGIRGELEVVTELDEKEIRVILKDTAAPFNPLDRKLPTDEDLTAALDEREIGGLGIFLTLHGVDEFKYRHEDSRNINTFIMRTVSN